MLKSISETIDGYIEGAVAKTKNPLWKVILLGIMAGFFIGAGAAISNVAMHSITSVGVARLVAGCTFPIGLMLIVFLGGELFTGDCMIAMACLRGKVKVTKMIGMLILVWITNLVGGLLMALMIASSGQLAYSNNLLGAFTIKLAVGKAGISFGTGVCSGILCNIFVCAAVLMAAMAKDMAGKVMGIFFPIMSFVIGGFEHCVANMYYIPAGIFAAGNATYADVAAKEFGITGDQLASLNWGTFFLNNELPVTIGNIIGGMVCISLVLILLNGRKSKA
uniref:formate/nitrite transporter family protein n=1 Tax=Eubacterium cellulosolvens TaxID=29322 RepID=UPI000487C5BC|nr:formate/nitrite transporter family protein [[Eubacterium] cellulosolvens]